MGVEVVSGIEDAEEGSVEAEAEERQGEPHEEPSVEGSSLETTNYFTSYQPFVLAMILILKRTRGSVHVYFNRFSFVSTSFIFIFALEAAFSRFMFWKLGSSSNGRSIGGT